MVVCRDRKNSTYYPISIFSNEDGICSLNNLTQLEILEPSYNQLQILICKIKTITNKMDLFKHGPRLKSSSYLLKQRGLYALHLSYRQIVMVIDVHWANVFPNLVFVIKNLIVTTEVMKKPNYVN